MRQCIDDGFLYNAMPAAEADMLSAIPPEDELKHTFSRRFERKMQALLRYERRTPFARRAAAVGRGVAAAVLAVLILNAALIGGVKAYRESFYEIVETVTRKYTAFNVKVSESVPPAEFAPIEPPYVPEGYVVAERSISDIAQTIVYLSDEGKDIIFSQAVIGSGLIYADTEGALIEDKTVSGYEVRVISENEMTQIFFVAADSEFVVMGTAGYEEILKVTENILKIFEN